MAFLGVIIAVLSFGIVSHAQTERYAAAGINNATLTTRNVSYSDSTGTSLSGYFAYDSATNDRRGLVLIVPDWDGIGPYERWRAQLLATLGYAAFVADVYGSAIQQGPSLPQANRSAQTSMYTSNQTLLVTRLYGALDAFVQAKQQAVVDPTKIVAIGCTKDHVLPDCFGGGAVMQLARSYPNPGVSGLKGVVTFHGSQLAQKAGDRNFTQGNPIAVVVNNGYLDPSNNATQLANLQAELQAALITFQLTNYGETVHAFTEPNLAPWSTSTNGTQAYTKYADIMSWWSLRSFLLYQFGALDAATNPYTGQPGIWDMESDAVATA